MHSYNRIIYKTKWHTAFWLVIKTAESLVAALIADKHRTPITVVTQQTTRVMWRKCTYKLAKQELRAKTSDDDGLRQTVQTTKRCARPDWFYGRPNCTGQTFPQRELQIAFIEHPSKKKWTLNNKGSVITRKGEGNEIKTMPDVCHTTMPLFHRRLFSTRADFPFCLIALIQSFGADSQGPKPKAHRDMYSSKLKTFFWVVAYNGFFL